MIEKIKKYTCGDVLEKINELVGAVNELQLAKDVMFNRIDILNHAICKLNNAICEIQTPAENVQPDYVTTSYMTDGRTKEYYGQNGASIVTDYPLPAGYPITIKEPETKGGDNEQKIYL